MKRSSAPRPGVSIAILVVLIALMGSGEARALSASPSPSTTGSYTVNWGVTLGCIYTDWDGWIGSMECYTGYDNAGTVYGTGYSSSFSGKAPGTYTYELVYEMYWVYYGVPELATTSTESINVQVVAPTPPSVWSLTNDQRRSYLNFYAPIIFKRGNEDENKKGYDWITNFDFDQDGMFGTNLVNGKQFPSLVQAASQGSLAFNHWRLRPTLYTALIEFQDAGAKELMLLYHVYHPFDDSYDFNDNGSDPSKIHDWERVEIHLKNVTGNPGSGETVNYVVLTQHHRHVVKTGAQSQFMQTPTGKHVMIWQAEWSNVWGAPHAGELRFLDDTQSYLSTLWNTTSAAEVDINNASGRKNVHYVFVPEGSSSAVSTFGAKRLAYSTAGLLASGFDNDVTISWNGVKRITYELQDVADIFPTHWALGSWAGNWNSSRHEWISLSPLGIVDESGAGQIPAPGLHQFFSNDTLDSRDGYPGKAWLWGTYNMDENACDDATGCGGTSFMDDALTSVVADWRGRTRAEANGVPASANAHWWQHDYFVHYGYRDDSDDYYDRCLQYVGLARAACAAEIEDQTDPGYWLTGPWYAEANGGFDGRWVSLFDDAAGQELVTPLEVQRFGASAGCTPKTVTARISGGRFPYTVTWAQGQASVSTNSAESSYAFAANVPGTLHVSSADGQTNSLAVHCY